MIDGEIVQNEELNLRSDKVRNSEDATPAVKEFDNIIKCKKKGILNLAYKLGLSFPKFKEPNRFKEMLKDIGISKSTIYLKVKLVKVLEKYPILKKYLLLLNFMKNYMKSIKQVHKERGNELNSFNDAEIC